MTTTHHELTPYGKTTPIRNATAVTAYINRLGLNGTIDIVIAIFLDRDNHPLSHVQYKSSTPNPQQVFRDALDSHAHFVILVQQCKTTNSKTKPVLNDVQIRHVSRRALTGFLLEIPVLDYLVLTSTTSVSLLYPNHATITDIARQLTQPSHRLCLN